MADKKLFDLIDSFSIGYDNIPNRVRAHHILIAITLAGAIGTAYIGPIIDQRAKDSGIILKPPPDYIAPGLSDLQPTLKETISSFLGK